MTRVIVVCAAGASSTFLARKLISLAAESGLDWDVSPAPLETVAPASTDIVGVSAHVMTESLRESFEARGVRYVVLPEHVNGVFGAEDALAVIAQFVSEDGGRTDLTVGSAILEETR